MTAVRRLLTIVLAASAMTLSAQTPAPTARPADVPRETAPVTADTDKDVNNPRALKLTLGDAITTSVRQNLGVEVQQYTYLMSGQLLRESYGIFDWLGNGQLSRTSSQSPNISRIQATSSNSTTANVGVGQEIPTGGLYNLTWTNSRTAQTGSLNILNPSFRSGLDLQFTQPLLRNFGVDVTRRGITVARNNLGINREAFRGMLMDTASSVEQAYLDLVYARRYVDVVKEAAFLARDQARITQIRIDVGASAPLDILQPRVQIGTTEGQLITAVAGVRDAEDRLRALMNLPTADWDRPIIPTDDVTYAPVTIDTEQAVARAYQLRPELKESQLTTANRRVQYVYARNQVLPKVDLALEYSTAGLAGNALATDPLTGQPTGLASTGYSHALSQALGRDFPTWTVGVNVAVPILNIAARAEAKRSELDLQQSRALEDQTRQSIAIGVRAAARAIDTTAKEISTTRTARDAAEQNVAAERKRYENGLSTNFQVLQIQQQLSDARASELQALVGYNKAVAAYHRAVGDLLDVRGISVEIPTINEPSLFSSWDRYNWLNYGNRVRSDGAEK